MRSIHSLRKSLFLFCKGRGGIQKKNDSWGRGFDERRGAGKVAGCCVKIFQQLLLLLLLHRLNYSSAARSVDGASAASLSGETA